MQTEAAQCAKLAKSLFKAKYPGIKVSVRSENYSGGNSVRLSYTDGPAIDDVKKLTEYRLQYGNFDGMTDMYNYDNCNEELPQVKYFFVDREFSDKAKEDAKAYLMKYWQIEEWNDQAVYDRTGKWCQELIRHYLWDKSFIEDDSEYIEKCKAECEAAGVQFVSAGKIRVK